jgi:uncharacterized protein
MPNRLAAITGASAGIGAEFARKLAARGYDLLLIARRLERLENMAAELPGRAEPFSADLAVPEDLERVAARMHRVHIDAILRLTHAALPGMVRRNEGGVVNVSSVAAFARSPANVSYCATKTWINAFTEGVYLELRGNPLEGDGTGALPRFHLHPVPRCDRHGSRRDPSLAVDDGRGRGRRFAGLDTGKLFVIPGWEYRLFVSCFTRLPAGIRLSMEGKSPPTRSRP